MKYAKYLPELKRRETFDEIVDRNVRMHQKQYPKLSKEIYDVYNDYVKTKKVLPSMRSMQFAGKSIEVNPSRIFNCAFTPVDDWRVFSEIIFLLLGGTGVGFSVQKHHVEKLPDIKKPNPDRKRRYLVGDSIEGWADAIKILMKSYFYGTSTVDFDFSDIRPKGSLLVTSGGKAPGPEPLKICIVKIQSILDNKKDGEQLTTIEVHDIICHLADAVLAGGIRRAALISLFSADDDEMISAKVGSWWELNPQRGRANNTAVLMRSRLTEDFFKGLWKRVEDSKSGEPGILLTNDKDLGTNPCGEISLKPNQFCNLTEVNVSNIESQEDLNNRVKAATFIGTLQAGYTNFHYLRPVWKRTTEKDALLGVGLTGIGSGVYKNYNFKEAAKIAKEENERVSDKIGINKASRITTIKPSGTSSITLGTASGIHAWFNDFYIRRVRVGKNEAIYKFLAENHSELIEDEHFRPHDTAIISVPIKAPEGSILRTESALSTLRRVKEFHTNWIKPGHRKGLNTNNVSVTISVKDDEWEKVGEWMWKNRKSYTAISVLPYDGGTYIQAPNEDITEEVYNQMVSKLHSVDLTNITEEEDNTELMETLACVSGNCEIT